MPFGYSLPKPSGSEWWQGFWGPEWTLSPLALFSHPQGQSSVRIDGAFWSIPSRASRSPISFPRRTMQTSGGFEIWVRGRAEGS